MEKSEIMSEIPKEEGCGKTLDRFGHVM